MHSTFHFHNAFSKKLMSPEKVNAHLSWSGRSLGLLLSKEIEKHSTLCSLIQLHLTFLWILLFLHMFFWPRLFVFMSKFFQLQFPNLFTSACRSAVSLYFHDYFFAAWLINHKKDESQIRAFCLLTAMTISGLFYFLSYLLFSHLGEPTCLSGFLWPAEK